MKDVILKYSQPVLMAVLFVFVVFRSCNDDENTEKNFRRSVMIESKIDSLNSVIAGIDEKLIPVEKEIELSNKQIAINKNTYDKQKKVISGKPADTVYNWTKQQLRNRTK